MLASPSFAHNPTCFVSPYLYAVEPELRYVSLISLAAECARRRNEYILNIKHCANVLSLGRCYYGFLTLSIRYSKIDLIWLSNLLLRVTYPYCLVALQVPTNLLCTLRISCQWQQHDADPFPS